MAPSTGRDESRVAEFVEHFGAFLTHSGLPPIASRVWVLLLADDDGRMTAREIGEALGISPGGTATRAGRRLWLSAEMNDYILAAIGEAMTTWPQRKQELLGGLAGLHP